MKSRIDEKCTISRHMGVYSQQKFDYSSNAPLSRLVGDSQLIQCIFYTLANTPNLCFTLTSTPRSLTIRGDVFANPFGCKDVSTLVGCLHVGILSWIFRSFILDLFHLLP